MPRKELDYSKTHFYKIVCKNPEIKEAYVGHTLNFKNRKSNHKRTCYNEKDEVHFNFYLYQFIRENGGFDNFEMVLINTECCENALKARRREREYIEELNATLNQIKRPVRTIDEANEYRKNYYDENKEDIKQKGKQYRIENAQIIKEKGKEYREANKEKLRQKNKEYQENNKEKINKQRQEYRETNREAINERRKEHYNNNKEKCNEQCRKYYEKNKEILNEQSRTYRQNHLEERREKDRDYHHRNKEERNRKSREYYQRNKEKTLEQNKLKITCVCGSEVRQSDCKRHEKSKKHQDYINLLQD